MGLQVILPLALPVLIVLFFAVLLVKCYKKCPPDKLIVVYGKKRGEKGKSSAITSACAERFPAHVT